MAPEIYEEKNYDFKADIWALGILYFEIFKQEMPF